MKKVFCTLIIFALASFVSSAPVLSWIPPYSTDVCYENLEKDFGGYGPKDGLSHIALQFWVPDGSGGIKYASKTGYSLEYMNDDSVIVVRDWGNKYGIKTMLCLYNGENGWDWNLAVSAFQTNQDKTINALLSTVDDLALGGVEIDLEGLGDAQPAQKYSYITFVQKLGDSLEVRGKDLTVATFSWKYNAPNWDWWNEIAPHVTAITSMGYQEIGSTATGWASYSSQKAQINTPEKLMLGVPDNYSSWLGSTFAGHLQWIANDGVVGVGLWDMQLRTPTAQSSEVWRLLSQIRGSLVKTYTVDAGSSAGGSIDPRGKVSVDSSKTQVFTASADEWFLFDHFLLNGVRQGSNNSITLENVTSDMTLEAVFIKDPSAPTLCTLVTTANLNGTITPADTTIVAIGTSKDITISAENGYVVEKLLVDTANCGPIVSLSFKNIQSNYTFEAFFKQAVGGDLGKYLLWEPPHQYPPNTIIAHNDTLWKYQGNQQAGGWGSTMEPSKSLEESFGTPPWLYAGLYNGVPDTTIEATAELLGGGNGIDTLTVTTETRSSGTLIDTKVETFYFSNESALEVIDSPTYEVSQMTIFPNPVSRSSGAVTISFPQNIVGTGTCTIYDAQGNRIDHQEVNLARGTAIRWDLCNEQGRRVAAGGYLAILQITDSMGMMHFQKAMIGVKN